MSESLRVDALRKSFPGVQVLKGVSFSLEAGHVYGLVGENGAGKSTLVKILMGIYQPDDGSVYVGGVEATLKNPHQVRLNYGIDAVFQEHALIPRLCVAENIFLDRLEHFYRRGLIDLSLLRERAREVLKLVHLDIDTAMLAEELSEEEHSLVELAKVVFRDPSILILDEITAALETKSVERLFSIIGDLKAKGKTIIFISHRLQEVLSICDEILVMKNGNLEGILGNADRDDPASKKQQLISMMVGVERTVSFPPKACTPLAGELTFSVRGVSNRHLHGIDLDVHKGEIVALAGLRGQGQSTLLRSIAGLTPRTQGEIYVGEQKTAISSPLQAVKQGVFYVSARRDLEELWLSHDVSFNITLPTTSSRTTFGFISAANEKEVRATMDNLSIVASSTSQMVLHLSGGNRQKVVMGKHLLARPKVLLLDQPTIGLDINAKVEIYHLLRQLSEQGIPIVVVLNDFEEILNLPDRILILREGRIVKELSESHISEQELLDSYYTLDEERA